ncbi:MAG: hypothetical protein HY039_08975 [Nitrospirae bacterium]|nr:hypothetical protein [Nitrospirota bacterium]
MDEKLCTTCGFMGPPTQTHEGNWAFECFLWLFFCLPGILYSLWRTDAKLETCPKCGKDSVIPLDSPKAKDILIEKRAADQAGVTCPACKVQVPRLSVCVNCGQGLK